VEASDEENSSNGPFLTRIALASRGGFAVPAIQKAG
jgi:hypothetical protein